MTRHQKELEKKLLGQLKTTKEDIEMWQNDPYLMDSSTVIKFWDYIKEAKTVIIVGDYDCDGILASYSLSKAVQSLYPDKKLIIRIPKRQAEGYGINVKIADEIKEKTAKGSLIITVDNGIAAAPLLEDLKQNGYKVIVTDHHELGENKIPEVDMVLNPAVDTCNESFNGKYWCGTGVVFKLCEQVISRPLAKELECFAGISTVADCVPLKEGNWGLVKKSINQFRKKTSPIVLNNLLLEMKQDPQYANEDSFGFYLGPAFNAAGRLYDNGPSLVLKYLFTGKDEYKDQIIEYNNQRKEIRDKEYELVKKAITATNQQNACPIWVYVPNLHEGIVGILAGKVVEDYNVPAIVLTDAKEPGIIKGSARSIPEVHIFDYLVQNHSLMYKYGGHAGAAGLSIKKENLKELQKCQIKLNRTANTVDYDAMEITKEEIPDLLKVVNDYLPYGEGNPIPFFAVDIDMSADKAVMIGANRNHMIIDKTRASDGGYKITHFFHDPNNLSDKNNFKAIGNIYLNGFKGLDYANFNTKAIEDIHDDKDYQK